MHLRVMGEETDESRAFAAGGGYLGKVRGFRRPFSLADRAIAYPLKPDIVTLEEAAIACFLGPAIIILVLAFVLPSIRRPDQKRVYSSWRDKFWDANAGWMGLGVSLAATLFITSGLKAVVGKARPNLLAICNADIENLGNFVVGGSGSEIESDAPAMVTYEICRPTDLDLFNDAFFAFPSGHSSMSWAGLLYLSLWLCMKLSVVLPYLGQHMPVPDKSTEDVDVVSYYHERRSAPPLWKVTIAMIPIGVALFICASRYADFHHAGIDIFAGCVIGIICAYTAFRLYHLPVQRGYGLAWGPRDEENAYLGDMPWNHRLTRRSPFNTGDEEAGHHHARPSTSAEGMLEYGGGRGSPQYPMQTFHSPLESR